MGTNKISFTNLEFQNIIFPYEKSTKDPDDFSL